MDPVQDGGPWTPGPCLHQNAVDYIAGKSFKKK